MDNLINLKEAAAFLNVSPSFIRQRISDRYNGLFIKSYRIAGRLKFRKSELSDWANFHENASASEGKEAVTPTE
jgi:hypothetical protein